MKKRILILFGFLPASFAFAQGGGGGVNKCTVNSISPSSAKVCSGDSKVFTADVTSGGTVTWRQSAGTLSVSGNTATWTASADFAGTATITASCDNSSKSASVTMIKLNHTTVSPSPGDRSRTTIGIGEEVDISTAPSTSVSWSVSGGGSVDPPSGTMTRFWAPKSAATCTVKATMDGHDCTLVFNVIEPVGQTSHWESDCGGLALGPPNQRIATCSTFLSTVKPTTVSFYNVSFAEEIGVLQWTWPDGTHEQISLSNPGYTVSAENVWYDTYSSGSYPIERIRQGGTFVDFMINSTLQDQFETLPGIWINYMSRRGANFLFRGSDQKAIAERVADNDAYGTWQGPWQ